MAHYDLGIMDTAPVPGRWYDDYKPEQYRCISIEDDLLEPVFWRMPELPCFWCTLSQPGKGIDWTGVNLIPPSSLPEFLHALRQFGDPELILAADLVQESIEQETFMILFGL